MEIIVEPETLEFYGISLSQISQMIAENNSLVAVGKVKNEGGTFSVKIPSTIESVYELYDFPIFSDGSKVIKLKDITKIKKTYKDPEYIARVNGKPAIVLEVSKRTGANIISTVKEVKKIIAGQKMYLPSNMNIIYRFLYAFFPIFFHNFGFIHLIIYEKILLDLEAY